MSLYKFIESNIKAQPDLAKINYTNPLDYEEYFNIFRMKERRFSIEAFINPLFYNNLVKCSGTIKEFDELKLKVKKIAQVSQKLFILSLLNDKLEKEELGKLVIKN